jgi:hypothetical protein
MSNNTDIHFFIVDEHEIDMSILKLNMFFNDSQNINNDFWLIDVSATIGTEPFCLIPITMSIWTFNDYI